MVIVVVVVLIVVVAAAAESLPESEYWLLFLSMLRSEGPNVLSTAS